MGDAAVEGVVDAGLVVFEGEGAHADVGDFDAGLTERASSASDRLVLSA